MMLWNFKKIKMDVCIFEKKSEIRVLHLTIYLHLVLTLDFDSKCYGLCKPTLDRIKLSYKH